MSAFVGRASLLTGQGAGGAHTVIALNGSHKHVIVCAIWATADTSGRAHGQVHIPAATATPLRYTYVPIHQVHILADILV